MKIKQEIIIYGTALTVGIGAALGIYALESKSESPPTFEEFINQKIAGKQQIIERINHQILETKLKGLETHLANVNAQNQILKTQKAISYWQEYLKNLGSYTKQ